MKEDSSAQEEGKRPGLKPRHIAAATLGNAIEFYDFLTYSFFSIQIGHAFFPAQSPYASLMLSLATFGVGFVTRPIGAYVIGNYSDRVGRRPAMMLCLVMMGFAIVGMALTPTYSQIGIVAPVVAVLLRAMQGFSLGGEIGSNTAFLLEGAQVERRGLMVSWQGASQAMALLAGGAVGVVLTRVLPAEALDSYGWRIAFLLGAVAVPIGFWLRADLPETVNTPELSRTPAAPESRAKLAYTHRRIMCLGLVVLASNNVAAYVLAYIVTYAQGTLHFHSRVGFIAETCGNLLAIPLSLLGGWLSDKYGRRPINFWGSLAFVVAIYPAFAWVIATRSEFALIVGMSVLIGLFWFTSGSLFAALSESLPQTIRGSGFGIVYSVAVAAFGGTTQLVVTWLIHVTGSAMAPAWYVIGAAVIAQAALMLIPESAPVCVACVEHPTKPLPR